MIHFIVARVPIATPTFLDTMISAFRGLGHLVLVPEQLA